ncbi:MAG: response regulator [Polyangiaceae bacterium]|nr:response regulator [Polyangiaceae bacterium]
MASPARVLVVDDSPTILKVVSAILARPGYEPAVARDGVAGIDLIKRGPKFDLVLLDFVMPRMNGYAFCRELRSSPTHRSLPVVLMSAKGDKIRGQFVQQTGAVDAITKPFDARALVAVVEGALAKTAEGRARPIPEGQTMPDEDTIAESIRPSMVPRHLRQRAGIELAQQLATTLTPAIMGLPPEARASEAAVMQAIAAAMTSEVIAALSLTLRDLDSSQDVKEVMAGDISAVPLAEVLQLLQMQRQTGVLRVLSNRASVTISIRQGLIDLVQTRGASDEFKLGRYFIERGLVSREQLEAVLRDRKPGVPTGQALVDAGHAAKEDLIEILARQASELIYEVLRWSYGRFSFTREPFRPEAEAARLGLGVSALVLEGFRRVDEWRLMEGTINFDQVVIVDQVALDSVGSSNLTRTEQMVLGAVTGARTVSEIIKESSVGSFDAIKAIYQFLQSRVLRSRAA